MVNFGYYCILLITSSFLKLSTGQKYEFDECDKTSDGIHYCRKQTECPSVDNTTTMFLKVCSRRGRVTIVCCPPTKNTGSAPIRGTRAPLKMTPSPSKAPANNQAGQSESASIVQQMCKEYAEMKYIKTPSSNSLRKTDSGVNTTINPLFSFTLRTWVVGGEPAEPKEFSHMALIGYGANLNDVTWACGGTLISKRYVLSAAHCASSGSLGLAKWARLGELDYSTSTDDASPRDFEITERIIHPDYKEPFIYNDIALFKLSINVFFNEYMNPICLNTVSRITQKAGTATGWGVIGTGYSESTKLLKVNVTLVAGSSCRKSFGTDAKKYPKGIDADKMLCAGEAAGGKDTCSGDSGGPLLVNVANEERLRSQIGVISFGDGFCARPGRPGVYTRVAYYIKWIQKIVWP